jgi:hypothetical protein
MMTNTRRTRRPRRARAQQNDQRDARVVDLLTDIKHLNQTQVQGSIPAVPDVEPAELSPRRLVNIVREVALGAITLSTAPLDTFGAYAIRLSDLPVSSELTTTFDDYRIMSLQFTFMPTNPSAYAGPLLTVIDYDTSSAPSSINDVLQYKTLQKTESGATHIRTLTPRVADALYSGAFTSYGLQSQHWISTDSPNVFHYGLRWAIAGITGTGANTVAYYVFCRAHLQFRNTR